ncbi:Exoglucanase 1 [Rhypophila decipiens]
MFVLPLALFTVLLPFSHAQQVGSLEKEVHPKLQWSKCTTPGDPSSCQTINGEITLDSNFRWLHRANGYTDCFHDNRWNNYSLGCNSTRDCTENCALEGVDFTYSQRWNQNIYGLKMTNSSMSMRLVTKIDFGTQIGSKFYLLEDRHNYQMFTLLGNELSFDVDLSTVGCGVNAALRFVAMEQDGGLKRYPGNNAGAEYGTGYCDSKCTRTERFVGGEANYDGWKQVNESDWSSPYQGESRACCPEMAVWNSNAHSYQISSHLCPQKEYVACKDRSCDYYIPYSDDEDRLPRCDRVGCGYNPFQMGNRDFYGKGKILDTSRNFTVVTRFEQDRVNQFFLQDGKKIEPPKPKWDELKDTTNGISQDMCTKRADGFGESDFWNKNQGWKGHLELMKTPMVLAVSIDDDDFEWNLFLDSVWPPDQEHEKEVVPGVWRGDCPWQDNEPNYVYNNVPYSTVVWSNLRFGPIGSTIKV